MARETSQRRGENSLESPHMLFPRVILGAVDVDVTLTRGCAGSGSEPDAKRRRGRGSLLSGILEPGPAARDGRWLRWGFAHRLLRKAKCNTTLQSASPRPPRLSGGMVACEPDQAGCSRCLGPPAASDRRASCRRPGFLLTCRSRRPACWRACQRAYWLAGLLVGCNGWTAGLLPGGSGAGLLQVPSQHVPDPDPWASESCSW